MKKALPNIFNIRRVLTVPVAALVVSCNQNQMNLQSLIGTEYGHECKDCPRWGSLPEVAKSVYGTVISDSGHGDSFYSLEGFRIGSKNSFAAFVLSKNTENGGDQNKILGVLDTSQTGVMFCAEDALDKIAVLTDEEHESVISQNVNLHDGQVGVIANPKNAYLLDSEAGAIKRIDGSGLVCKGYPRG